MREEVIQEMRIRNYSERTITGYISSLSQLSKYYKCSPDQLTLEQFKRFAYHLIHDKGAAVSTINILISSWRILQVDILGKEWDSLRIKRPRRGKRLPEVLSQDQAKLLINTPTNIKHRTLLSFTYATGMRKSEVINLKWKDMCSKRMVIRVVAGKGNKSRELPLSVFLHAQLKEYFTHYHPVEYLFEGLISGKPYSETSFAIVVKKAGVDAGLNKNVYPHVLRHSYASHMVERGMSIKRLQYLMGHNSLSTTMIYLHLASPLEAGIPDLLDE